MKQTGLLSGISVAHTHATLDEIDAAGHESVRAVVSDLLARESVEEAFAIQTCNRAEAFVVTDSPMDGMRALGAFAPDVREGAIRHLDHEESLRHLMRVAAGLESLVVGEDQIIGQVRDAFEESRSAGGIGPVLDSAVTKALHVGERARTETGINDGVVSLGSAAIALAEQETDLSNATALVVGAGEMGTLTARALDETAVSRVVVANRTISTAEHVAGELETDTEALPLAALSSTAAAADLVVSATGSPDPILERDHLVDAGDTICVDIARPRDIDPAVDELELVTRYDIDDLHQVTETTRNKRTAAAEAVESIIDTEFDRLLESFKRNRADDAISAMYESAERTKQRELSEAITRLESQGELTDEQRETVEALADSIVGQLLAAPTKSLRDAAGEDDWTTIRTALALFDPEFDAPPDVVGEAEFEGTDVPDGIVGGTD